MSRMKERGVEKRTLSIKLRLSTHETLRREAEARGIGKNRLLDIIVSEWEQALKQEGSKSEDIIPEQVEFKPRKGLIGLVDHYFFGQRKPKGNSN